MPWVLRGLRHGVATTGWPKSADPYFDSWTGVAQPRPDAEQHEGGPADQLEALCPSGAIGHREGWVVVDAGGCIGCGRCIVEHPDIFEWRRGSDPARFQRAALVVPGGEGGESGEGDDRQLEAIRADLARRTRTFGRSVHIRHVDAGSDGAEEWEVAALLNPIYDIHRLGLFFTASPRHADILLVTGIGATGMREPLARTLEAMPEPVVVVAVGTDACSGGMFAGSYAGSDGVDDLVDVDVWVPGAPPSPFAILHGLLLALDWLPGRVTGFVS
ncbi:hypothetical protein [Lapillicoccus sp.]|uniref:NADH-quinone oxidoreductase subunit B family protein n=1 Tax=Lapillicoccus sp. TaxID=1909287 RepID=UPI0032654053